MGFTEGIYPVFFTQKCDNLITKNVLAFISHENVKICRELIDDVKNLKDEKGNINMEMFEKSNEIIKEFEYYLEN